MDSKQKIASKIIGIQFSILSPEEIKRMSVAEITNKETYQWLGLKNFEIFDGLSKNPRILIEGNFLILGL